MKTATTMYKLASLPAALLSRFLITDPASSSPKSRDDDQAAPPGIALTDVSIRYGDTCALHNASLHVGAGSITALVGPSGCGKSSLLSVINRLCDLHNCEISGEVRIADKNILGIATDITQLRREVGMVFQRPNPFPLSIYENLRLPLREHGIRAPELQRQKIESVLRHVGLWSEVSDRLQQSALMLSGGQQQRLCIARALILEPKVLLLDEPCSALDPVSTQIIEELITQLRGRYTVLMVTHNLAQARRVADHVAVCWVENNIGCIVESGTTQQLFDAPQSAITAAYLSGHSG